MGEASQINEGSAGPPEKPVFNPNAPEKLSKEVVVQKSSKLIEKMVYLLGAGMKRYVVVKKPDGKELFRTPLTLFIVLILLSQFLILIAAAILVVFFKWKIELEDPKKPVDTSPPPASPSLTPPVAESDSGYSEPTLPPMPT